MKKLLFSIAVLGSWSDLSLAQSNVVIYGVVDAGLNYESGGPNGSAIKLTQGMESSSRLGFKGSENLGGGLSANFVLESGISIDTGGLGQGGAIFGRQATIGLKNAIGEINLGRQYTPMASALYEIDPFGTALAGAVGNMMSQGGTNASGGNRMINSIRFTSATYNGFSGDFGIAFGEVAGDSSAARGLHGALGYTSGSLTVKLAYQDVNDATASSSARATLIGAKYNFGIFTGHIGYEINKGAIINNIINADTRDLLIGISAPIGIDKLMLSYIGKKDRTALKNDAHQIAIGYVHPISKRTDFYTSYGRIYNSAPNTDANLFYKIGTANDLGTGDRTFNLGMRHTF